MLDEIFAAFDNDPNLDAPAATPQRKAKRARKLAEPVPADMDMSGRLTDAGSALRFILAGHATITMRSKRTGTRYTYKISKPEDDGRPDAGQFFFVALLRGADNENDYSYFGYIRRGVFYHGGQKAKVSREADSVKAFDWSYRKLITGEMPNMLEIWHEGCCGRCGRKLTVPESISSGFGPECITKV